MWKPVSLEQLIELALKSLPEQTAMIYSFSRNIGLTYTEIAEKLELSQKTIAYHVSSALRIMRRVVEKYGYALADRESFRCVALKNLFHINFFAPARNDHFG